jgi:hypothetical protein
MLKMSYEVDDAIGKVELLEEKVKNLKNILYIVFSMALIALCLSLGMFYILFIRGAIWYW